MNLDNPDDISKLDSREMLGVLRDFDGQLKDALALGETFTSGLDLRRPGELLFCGMGGSAVGADLIGAYLGRDLALPLQVCRGYDIPAFTGESTLAVVCSYSGNTEETLSCFHQLAATRAQIVCLTSGGELADLALGRGCPRLMIPPNMQPRAAIGFTVVPMLCLLAKAGLIGDRRAEILEMIETARFKSRDYGASTPAAENAAKRLAQKLQGKINVIHGSQGRLDAVARRWAAQLNENAKQLSYFTALPELTHNEIEGWRHPHESLGRLNAVFLDDRDDHPRIRLRGELMRAHLERRGCSVISIASADGSWAERLWGLVLLGDYASVYTALLNGEDPTPVEGIEELKRRMR